MWDHLCQRLFDSDYIYRILPTGDNLEANAIALSKAFGVKEQLKQIYGIEYLKVDNVHLDLFDVMMTLSLSQAHYLKDHIHKFEQFLSDSNFNLEALSKLMMHGFIIGENRMPMTFALENDKSKKMSSWITEGSNNQKLKQIDFLHKSFFNQFNCLSFTQSKLYMPASKLNRRFNLLRRFLYTQDKILKHFILPNTCST